MAGDEMKKTSAVRVEESLALTFYTGGMVALLARFLALTNIDKVYADTIKQKARPKK
jgi:hypothetical protein